MKRIVLTMLLACGDLVCPAIAPAQYVMEHLGRGIVARRTGESSVYVGWRLLGTDPIGVGFNVYRQAGGGRPTRLNRAVLTKTTDYLGDGMPPPTRPRIALPKR